MTCDSIIESFELDEMMCRPEMQVRYVNIANIINGDDSLGLLPQHIDWNPGSIPSATCVVYGSKFLSFGHGSWYREP